MECKRRIRVLVVDRNPLVREGLALLIGLQPDMQLIGAAATMDDALLLYLESQPDVTVVDLDAPSADAIAAIRKIRARDAGARVIGLSTYGPEAARAEALAAGGCECLGKDRLSDSLPPAIRNATP